ncbi:hypothetical protein Hanom_Chr09g00808841 [Helianthus anomalus]
MLMTFFSYLCLPRCLAGLTNTSQSPKPGSLPLNVSAAVNGVALVGTKASTKTFYNFQFCFVCSGSLGSLNQVSVTYYSCSNFLSSIAPVLFLIFYLIIAGDDYDDVTAKKARDTKHYVLKIFD